MISITDRAKEELKRIVEVRNLDPGKYLRLATPPMWEGSGDFGIVIGEEGADDKAIVLEGLTILLVDKILADSLTTSRLDFKHSSGGSRFTLDVFS